MLVQVEINEGLRQAPAKENPSSEPSEYGLGATRHNIKSEQFPVRVAQDLDGHILFIFLDVQWVIHFEISLLFIYIVQNWHRTISFVAF